MHSRGNTVARPDPYNAMLRGGIVPATAVGLVAIVVFAVVQGGLGAAGAVLATLVVLLSTVSTLVVLRMLAGMDPRVVLMGALVAYFFKVMLLGIFLLLFRHADWLSPLAFAVTAIIVSLAGTIGEIVAFTRVRTFIYDELSQAPEPSQAPEVRR